MTYAVGAPCPKRTRIFDMWLDAVEHLDPRPDEIVVSSEEGGHSYAGGPFPEDPRYTLVRFKHWVPPYVPERSYGGSLLRIGQGREAVRRYVCERGYDWLLFIDSDVVVPPNTFKVLHGLAKKHRVPIVQNLAEQKHGGVGAVWFGCVLLNRAILRMVHFFSLARSGNRWLSEDWIFFAIVGWYNWWRRKTPDQQIRWLRGPMVPVKHYYYTKDGKITHRPVLHCNPAAVRPQKG